MSTRVWTTDDDALHHQVPADLGESHVLDGNCWCRPRFYADYTHHRPHWETIAYLEERLTKVKQQRTEARQEAKALKAENDDMWKRLEEMAERLEQARRRLGEQDDDSNVVSIDR